MKHCMCWLMGSLWLAGCGGKSADTPPPENGLAEPTPVEVIEEEAPPDTGTEETESAVSGEDEPSAQNESPAGEAEPEPTSEPEAPPPPSDLQAYVGASTGYTPEFRTVKDNMDKFKQCYLDAMRVNPDISGTIKVRFTVLKSGKVKKAKATLNELNDEVAKCVIAEMKSLKFPKRGNKRTVEYPFQFIPSPD